ncbi:MAG: DUF1553 domain-containing protein [Verrucomicrobiales bacterium]|nr:DUF1553 domain-containing protein [Verrucomicrobiales bacterium]
MQTKSTGYSHRFNRVQSRTQQGTIGHSTGYSPVLILALFSIFSLAYAAEEPKPVLEYSFEEAKDAGPQAPRYPGFAEGNTARRFEKKENAIVVESSDDFLFEVGDSITMEAWINVSSIGTGHMPYLIGKGRHDNKMDQNFALRLKSDEQGVRLGFLFTSELPTNDSEGDGPRQWHRWWSNATLPSGAWHHVALVYTFGKANSLRAYIDGKSTDGVWDMGGKTDRPPVADDSDLVIGTGYQRGGSQTFNGKMDDIRIYHDAVPEEILTSRFAYNPPPPQITKAMLKPGEVLVQISENGVPEANSWPDEPEVTESYSAKAFGFHDWPQKYISTGVRADRSNPSHFRASALVEIPQGKHRLLLRGRGATRLYIDGKKVLENRFPGGDTGGHGVLSSQDEYLDLGPDFRFAPPGNRENWVEFTSKGGEHFVILESMIGGVAGKNKRRPEFGETVAAISPEGSESWQLLTPDDRHISYTDQGWMAYEKEVSAWLKEENARRRAVCRAEHSEYWSMRQRAADDWLAGVEPVEVPALPDGLPALNEIDYFIGAKIASVRDEATVAEQGGADYYREIQPLLEAKCYDCHKGSKIKGGLRLDTLEAALKGGEVDGPAITPGNVDESSILWRVHADAGDDIMPPKGDPLSDAEVALLERWIKGGAPWPQFDVPDFTLNPLSIDLVFLRRLAIDTVGVPPTEAEIETFLSEPKDSRRAAAIDRYLVDERWADNWMGYWQDVLAENPNIINPTLNNTGPFRWWIHESLVDNKPLDLFVTELIRMEGSDRFGGPRGFGTASQNDVPMAAKGIIISSAFLGVEMKCARCHDAPGHEWMQKDLFQLAAMLGEKPIKLPMTSSVPMDKLHERARKPLIQVTLKPGTTVTPEWPFPKFVNPESALALAGDSPGMRDKLAALITAPENERFAQVMANRIWARIMGRGLVDSVHDWEKGNISHPGLLKWIGRQLVANHYDTKELARLIFNSHAYQRATDATLQKTSPLYISPAPRRLMAEQIVDSLFSATGKPFDVGELSLDIDSVRAYNNSITLGKPRRAWMLASSSNERDRPSLSLPKIQAVAAIMETFGWRGARQDPITSRDTDENVLQPAILANGTMGVWLTRLSDDHGITALSLEEQPVDELVERLYLRLLTRKPSHAERDRYIAYLSEGYDDRIVPEAERPVKKMEEREPVRYVSWSNHLDGPANTLAQQKEMEARAGDPPTTALREDWRLRMEDVIWAMLNSPEWIYTP